MTTPPMRRDESVQFSLQELLKLEDERLEEARRDAKALAEREAEKARVEAIRRAEEENVQAAAIEKEIAAHKNAELDALAKREAMQKAVVEQARLEVEVRARTQERELERRHEIELERLRASTSKDKSQLRTAGLSALLGGAVMLFVLLGVHYGVTKPASDRQMAELQTTLAGLETRVSEADRRAENEKKRGDELSQKLAAALVATPTPTAATPPLPTRAPASVRGNTTGNKPPINPQPEIKCLKGDPLCGAIQ